MWKKLKLRLKRWGKATIAVLAPILLSVLVFYLKTEQLPSVYASTRKYQLASSYFASNAKVQLLPVTLRMRTSTSALVAFQKDRFIDALFGFKRPFEEVLSLQDQPYDNRVIVSEDVDWNVFAPLISFVWPFHKSYEIRWPKGPRLYDVVAIDIDGDGVQEIIISWLEAPTASSGTLYTLVINFHQDGSVTYEGLWTVQKDKEQNNSFVLQEPEETMVKLEVNGEPIDVPLPGIYTDVFWAFRNIDNDPKQELIMAYPHNDGDCHYCPQSWLVAVFEYDNGKFSLNPNFPILEIPKKRGLAITQMHGYTYRPLLGQIFYHMTPSWLEIEDPFVRSAKTRREPEAINLVMKRDGPGR